MSNLDHINDLVRICKVAKKHGHRITRPEANKIWREYSENFYAAGFLSIASDRQILGAIDWYNNNKEGNYD